MKRFPQLYLPKAIRTDSFQGYKRAIREIFNFKVKQDRFLSFKHHSNNEIENFFRLKRWFPRLRKIEVARKHFAFWLKESTRNEKGLTNFIFFPSTFYAK